MLCQTREILCLNIYCFCYVQIELVLSGHDGKQICLYSNFRTVVIGMNVYEIDYHITCEV